MNILITSGGTREYIDDVRVLTNISSGKLGAIIAERFLRDGHNVTYLHTKSAVVPEKHVGQQLSLKIADNVNDVFKKMEELVPRFDVVIHSMAISDFTFKRVQTKCSSDSAEAFVDFIRDNIEVAPKILPHIRSWNPSVKLISFKFQVGKTKEELKDIAMAQLKKSNSDFVLANDKKIMQESNTHVAWLYNSVGAEVECFSKYHIANAIYNAVAE